MLCAGSHHADDLGVEFRGQVWEELRVYTE